MGDRGLAPKSTSVLRVLSLLGLLYAFFISIDLIGSGFKLTGEGFAEALLDRKSVV